MRLALSVKDSETWNVISPIAGGAIASHAEQPTRLSRFRCVCRVGFVRYQQSSLLGLVEVAESIGSRWAQVVDHSIWQRKSRSNGSTRTGRKKCLSASADPTSAVDAVGSCQTMANA